MVSSVNPATAAAPAAPPEATPAKSASKSLMTTAFKVFQRHCGISRSLPMVTPSWGPCYVLTAHDPSSHWSLLAHIDDVTEIASVSLCCDALKTRLPAITPEEAVLQRCHWSLKGGYKGKGKFAGDSEEWGNKILHELEKNGIPRSQIDLTQFQAKKTIPDTGLASAAEIPLYCFLGGLLNPATGNFSHFAKNWATLDNANQENHQKEVIAAARRLLPIAASTTVVTHLPADDAKLLGST